MTEVQFRSDVVARLKDSMPRTSCDESIIEAMLVSSDKDDDLIQELLNIPKTEGRIKFLMKNRHGTPFEHNAMKFYVEAPIFVFREWHRHRIGQSYNEQSGRYSELPPMFYVPPPERPLVQVGKPGAYKYVAGDDDLYKYLAADIKIQAIQQYESYQERLKMGIAKEVARMSLGVNIYSKMYCTLNARALMNFLSLRTSTKAMYEEIGETPFASRTIRVHKGGAVFPSGPMWEIEQAARHAEYVFSELFPITYSAFNEFGRVAP